MPELSDVIGNDANSTIAAVAEQEQPADSSPQVVEATTVSKPKKQKKEVVAEDKPERKKAKKSEKSETTVIKLKRPSMEMDVQDFEQFLAEQSIHHKPIVKLGYKCGKIIWGIKSENCKDFRVIAYKARKKSKSVADKSRCIFYFGAEDHKFAKELSGVSSTNFGKCAVQCKKPLQVILDKNTFKEHFETDDAKVLKLLKTLTLETIKQKTPVFKAFQDKITAKSKKKQETED